ncbi:type II secretion system protein [Endothiovibrio diazotrophicus]
MRRNSGFTLIELAIVLVIVGLLLGGVMKGQQLIDGARVRNVIAQLEAQRSAILAFRDRYGALPGDLSRASTLLDAAAADGDGNGRIDSNAERAAVWQHLALAGLLRGSYDGIGVSSVWNGCPITTCPRNTLGGDILYNWGQQASGPGSERNELRSGGRLPAALLAEIDRRIDDGDASGGDFRAADYNAAECLSGGQWKLSADAPAADCAGVLLFY